MERLRFFLLKVRKGLWLIAVGVVNSVVGTVVYSAIGGGTVGLVVAIIVAFLTGTFVGVVMLRRRQNRKTSSSELGMSARGAVGSTATAPPPHRPRFSTLSVDISPFKE